MIAFVLEVIAASTACGSKVNVSSISTKTGIAPNIMIASKLATNVKVGIITSSPAPIPATAIATETAAVPLDTNWTCFTLNFSCNSDSSSFAFQCPLRIPSKP